MRSFPRPLRIAILTVVIGASALGIGRVAGDICPFPPRIVEIAHCRHADASTDFIDGLACIVDEQTRHCVADESVQTRCEGSFWTARVNGRCVDSKTANGSWSPDSPRCEENYATRAVNAYRFTARCSSLTLLGWECNCVAHFDDPPLSKPGDACDCRDLKVSSGMP